MSSTSVISTVIMITVSLAACSADADELTISIDGLPDGAEALIVIDTPEGDRIWLNESTVVGNLTRGAHTIRAGAVSFERRIYEPHPDTVTIEDRSERPIVFTYVMDESVLLAPGAVHIDTAIMGPIEFE